MPDQLTIKKKDAVRVIEFYNPPANYITHTMLRALYAQLVKDREDASIRVLILTGGLEDTFLTHYNVDDLLDFHRMNARKRSDRAYRRLALVLCWLLEKLDRWPRLDRFAVRNRAGRSPAEQSIFYWTRCLQILDSYPKPLIAAINGVSLGGGCEIALCCDFRYMADRKYYRIGLPEVLLGITPGGTGTPLRLPRIVGEAKALEMLLTGRIYQPSEAERVGLIHGAVPPGDLMPLVMELATRLSRGAPIAQSVIRSGIRLGSRLSWPRGRVMEMAGAMRAMSSADAARGMSAYLTKMASTYAGVDPEQRLTDFDALFNGRLTDYRGD